MKNFKIMLSVILSLIMISMSIMPSFAVVAPEDSFSGVLQWQDKIDEVLVEKMSTASDEELIPVWVWLTDIDVEALESEIETKTGISQQKLTLARSEIEYDVSAVSLDKSSTLNKTNSDKNVFSYLEGTKAQREKLANDTEIYLSTKKTLARQKYITANTTKLRKLGISNDKIEFKSELTPTFIAHLTKDEIIETAKSSDIVEIGYFSEYDEDNELELEPTQNRSMAEEEESTEAPTVAPTLDVSTLHTGIKHTIQHDLALNKYGATGNGIKVLHIDNDYIRSDKDNSHLIPNPDNIYDLINGETYEITDVDNIPLLHLPDENGKNGSHANYCVSYLQAFAEDVIIYSVPSFNQYNKLKGYNINPLDDVEYAIIYLGVDLISSSSNEGNYVYESNFSAKWYDAIVSMYNIPLIASTGNGMEKFPYPIAPACGYNSIAVGVYYCSNNIMINNYTYTQEEDEDRVAHKPDLVVAMDSYADAFGATSAGAPTVAAIVAMMMQLDPSLIGQPEVVKAILMASCHEKAQRSDVDASADIAQETMEEGLTLKQGAGKVNALRALNIVAFGTFGSGSLSPQQTQYTVKRFYINSEVNTDEEETYPLNVSIAWLRHNSKASNDPEDNQITLGGYFNPFLKVNYSNQPEKEIKVSEVRNAGKQLVFYENPKSNKQYNIRAYWDTTNTANKGFTIYGYAYSVGNFEKVLEKVEITGNTVLGETITANAYTVDGLLANPSALTYKWFKSADNVNWQIISGATSSTYTLTESDVGNYLRCRVEQNYLSKFWVTKDTIKKVTNVLYGDIDGDGEVTVLDASKLQLYLNGSTTLTNEQLIVADVSGDGLVDVLDVSLIQLYLIGNITCFPVEE